MENTDKEKTPSPTTEDTTEKPVSSPPPSEEKKTKGSRPKKEKPSAEVERLQKALDEKNDAYQRMLAEYANYKRRTEQEKEALGRFTTAQVLKALLPTLDNLERAIEAPDGADYKKGVEMVLRQLQDAFKELGLEEIEALGQPFNPELHNAVMRVDAEEASAEIVTQVFQKGYKLGDRILRPSMVQVAN